MSECYDTGDQDYTPEHNDHGHDNYGYSQEHAEKLSELSAYEAARHDVHFEHGHHIEYDDPKGGHYEESEYTRYDAHDAEARSVEVREYAEQDKITAYADDSKYLEAAPDGHVLQGLPAGFDQIGDYQPGDYQPGDYQPGDYHAGDYQHGGYQHGEYQPSDHQPSDYRPETGTEHLSGAESVVSK
jgi:hypothetical protein